MLKPHRYANELLGLGLNDANSPSTSPNVNIFFGKSFYCGGLSLPTSTKGKCLPTTKGNCCFNHIIGLPVKNNIVHEIYDYEIEMQIAIEQNQHVWIKKARGIGATEFLIRYLSWRALSSLELDGKSIFIIAGTREEFANEVLKRMERLFTEHPGVIRDSKHTECYINNTKFKVFPTKRLKDVRGYIDVAYLFIDEADYFDKSEQDELKYVIKSYEEKSKGKIILVSTAGQSGGLFEQIENDPNSDFHKLFMLVNKGRGKIFDDKFLDEQRKKDPAFFAREYLGQYGYGMGNCFLYEDIEKCCSLFKYPNNVNPACVISMGIDPSFGSSKFAITIVQLEDDIIKILYAEEYEKASYEAMLNLVARLKMQYGPQKIYVDAANPEFIKSLKSMFNESVDYDKIIERAKHDKVDYQHRMTVCPVSFSEYGKELLGRFQHFVSKVWMSISHEQHKELVVQMRMARFKDNGNLDKEEVSSSTFDVFDSTRLALMPFYTGGKR